MALEDTLDLERTNIDELRRRMKDLMTPELYEDDNVFVRFLKARNQNVDAAETMLKSHLRWRKIHKIDTIVNDFKPCEVIMKYGPITRIGFDKEGSPVLYIALGNTDCRGFFRCGPFKDFFYYLVEKFEKNIIAMKEQSKKIGKPVNQWILIFDYENFQLSNATHKPTVEFIINMMKMYEANYPERLKAAYLINGTFVFHIYFAMCKPFLYGSTAEKIKICGKDFQGDFREIMDAKDLPAFLGGSRTDPDGNPKCVQSINFGGEIPEYYFTKHQNRKLSVIPDARLLMVGRMSKDRVEVEVKRPGSSMQWRFTVKTRNIDFGVFYAECRCAPESEMEEVVPKRRVETPWASEFGMCSCEKAGIYILEFDNSYSWLNSKQIYYSINVSESDDP